MMSTWTRQHPSGILQDRKSLARAFERLADCFDRIACTGYPKERHFLGDLGAYVHQAAWLVVHGADLGLFQGFERARRAVQTLESIGFASLESEEDRRYLLWRQMINWLSQEFPGQLRPDACDLDIAHSYIRPEAKSVTWERRDDNFRDSVENHRNSGVLD